MAKASKKAVVAIPKKSFWTRAYRQRALFLMALLPVVFIFIFQYVPIYGILISFKNYKGSKGVWGSAWLKPFYQNFLTFFKNVDCAKIIWNTLKIGTLTLLFTFPLPIVYALLINEMRGKTYKKIVQTISYIPHFISIVVVCSMLHGFCSQNGFFNDIRVLFDLERVNLNAGPTNFMIMYILSAVWQGVGWGSILYLSALTNVDTSLYDVANIDGANRWQKMKNIAIPAIMPTITIVLIMNVGNVLSSDYTKILLLQNSTNMEATETIATYVYRVGILEGRFSYSTAVNLFQSIVCFILVYGANAITRKLSPENSMW